MSDDRIRIRSNGQTFEYHPRAWPAVQQHAKLAADGDLFGAIAAMRLAIAADSSDARLQQVVIMDLDMAIESPDVLLAERWSYDQRHLRPLTGQAAGHSNDPDPDRPLRVGYLGADFYDHSASLVYGHLIEAHDRDQCQPYLYMTGDIRDAVTERFRQTATWRPVYKESSEDLARIIRQDQIDVLVDLAGLSRGNRLLTLARKPAPIQVSAWGTATGTDADCIDYLVSDPVILPEDQAERYRTQVIRLPGLLSYRLRDAAPPVAPAPFEQNGYVTFGYLGRAQKISQETLLAWARILSHCPRSRLVLKDGGYSNTAMLHRILTPLLAHGIEANRISVLGQTARSEHLQAYHRLDIALDPWPENGGVTTCEAVLMGVPVVTRQGPMPPGRLGASILSHVGLPFARDIEEYVNLAMLWALDPAFLQDRPARRDALLESVLSDSATITRHWESELRTIWRRWCKEHD